MPPEKEQITIKTSELKTLLAENLNQIFAEKIAPAIGQEVADKLKVFVESMETDRLVRGKDISELSAEKKIDFVKLVRAAVDRNTAAVKDIQTMSFPVSTKANEALIEQQDNRGGYLVPTEIASVILRIAASVGTVISQAQKWDMKSDQLGIPNYTGAYLTGQYLDVDVPGPVTGLTFGQAMLILKQWQLAFVIGNDLLQDASVNLADWLLSIAGESLANMIDQQGLVGTGAPFMGILNNNAVPSMVLSAGKTTFDKYDVLVDSSTAIGMVEESILSGSAYYFHRTVWAALRVQKDTAGNFVLPFAGLVPGLLEDHKGGGPIRPAGQILGYPVYTNRWLPDMSKSAASTAFGIFGNMKAMAFGDKGDMRVAQFESGNFGGKEVALANQLGIVYRHRHGLVITLPKAFVQIVTSAS